MRFLALFRKELREVLPWMLLAAVVVLAIGGLDVLSMMRSGDQPPPYYYFGEASGYLRIYSVLLVSDLWAFAPLLLLTSCGLGLVVAGRQFLFPGVVREWPFTLHRSTTRGAVLLAKLCAAGAAFLLGIGAVWSVLYLYASQPGALRRPVEGRIYWQGWIYILLGVLAYFAAAVASLSRARWYATRLFPLVIAAIVIPLVLVTWNMAVVATVLLIGLALLAVQLIDLMLNREF